MNVVLSFPVDISHGHNVISGIFSDGIVASEQRQQIVWFLFWSCGLVDHNYMELTADIIDEYRNTVVLTSSVWAVPSWKRKNSLRKL